jgi:predicted nucleic acid-binding protein
MKRGSLKSYVLDSFALLVWLLDQKDANKVRAILENASAGTVRIAMSLINAGEVIYILAKKRGLSVAEEFEHKMLTLPVHYVTPEREDILAAARLKSRHSVSYADCFAINLAVDLKASLVTGDPEILKFDQLVSLEWLEQS